MIDWKHRALVSEQRAVSLTKMIDDLANRPVNPPMMLMKVDFEERWERAWNRLQKFHHLWGRLWWRAD